MGVTRPDEWLRRGLARQGAVSLVALLARPSGRQPPPEPPPPQGAIGLLALLAALLAACGSPVLPEGGSTSQGQTEPRGLTAALAASDLAVGPNQRFLLVLIGPDNRLVGDAAVDAAFFKVTGPSAAELRSYGPAVYQESPELPGRGIYVARADFDEPGDWGVVASVKRPGQEPTELRLAFKVKEKGSTPGAGDPVPASHTLTGTTAAEVQRFSSARPVDISLYRLSIADAIVAGKPFLVLFATPGFCTSRTCGPGLKTLQALRNEYTRHANFLHVEVYKLDENGQPTPNREMVPAVAEWGLPSEPWLFVVGADGRLMDKFEGSITVEEVRPALERAIAEATQARSG